MWTFCCSSLACGIGLCVQHWDCEHSVFPQASVVDVRKATRCFRVLGLANPCVYNCKLKNLEKDSCSAVRPDGVQNQKNADGFVANQAFRVSKRMLIRGWLGKRGIKEPGLHGSHLAFLTDFRTEVPPPSNSDHKSDGTVDKLAYERTWFAWKTLCILARFQIGDATTKQLRP